MNLTSKSITINSTIEIKFHPLAEKLYRLINEAYLLGDQQNFLVSMALKLENQSGIPINQISMISHGSGINAYQIIGGCFNPIFDIANITAGNTLFHSYSHSKKSSEAKFEQTIIDFIYLDFIRSISILSLKKPGAMGPQLRTLGEEYKSDIWSALFDGDKNYLRQIDLANLLDIKRDTISKQCKLYVSKSESHD